MRRLATAVTLCLTCLVAPAAALGAETPSGAADSRPVLAVLDFQPRGADALQAEAATLGAVRGLRQLDVFQVLASEDVKQLLAIERGRQLVGLTDAGASALTVSLGATHAVAGSLSKVGNQLTLEMRLLDTQNARVVAQKTLPQVTRFEDVAAKVGDLAQELVGPLLAAQQGELLVRAREEAAEVVVDDVLVSSTPMAQPVKLSRGAHRLVVRKDGFIAQARTVRIEPAQLAAEEVVLLPSADFAAGWERQWKPRRTMAYVAAGAGLAALVGGYGLRQWVTQPKYRNDFLPRQLTLKGATQDEVASANLTAPQDALRVSCGESPTQCREDALDLHRSLKVQQLTTIGLMTLGALSAGTGAYLYFTGEDPGRYRGAGKLSVAAVPGPGGGAVALSGSF